MKRSTVMLAGTVCAVALATGCGGGSSTPSTPTPPPVATTPTITIASNTFQPRELTINAGQRVLFVNNDSRAHDIVSDPHPEHGDCTELNQVGFLNPGQSRETGNFVAAKTCTFHDETSAFDTNLRGRITVR